MRGVMKTGMAAVLLVAGIGAVTPALAGSDGIAFLPVDPEGLDEAALASVVALQSVMPAQMAAYEAQGVASYGAFAAPKGQELGLTAEEMAKWFVMTDKAESIDDAKANVLQACIDLTNADECAVIGLIVPAE